MRRTETPKPIWINFGMVVDIPDVVTYTNFGDHRLRGFWVAGGQISPSPIDFHRRPYNTLALPCECVIQEYHHCIFFSILEITQEVMSIKFLPILFIMTYVHVNIFIARAANIRNSLPNSVVENRHIRVKHAYISFGCPKKLNFISSLT